MGIFDPAAGVRSQYLAAKLKWALTIIYCGRDVNSPPLECKIWPGYWRHVENESHEIRDRLPRRLQQGMSKVSLSSVVRDNTFEGAKCSTHFPRLTRLSQWSPHGINPCDVDAFMTRITMFVYGYREDGLGSRTTSA